MRVQARLGLTKLRHGVGELLFLLRLGFLLRGQRLATFGHELQVLLLGLHLLDLGLLNSAHEVTFHDLEHAQNPAALRLRALVGLTVVEASVRGVRGGVLLSQGEVDCLLLGGLVETIDERDGVVEGIQASLRFLDGFPVLRLLLSTLRLSNGTRFLELHDFLVKVLNAGCQAVPLRLELRHLGVQGANLLGGIVTLLLRIRSCLVAPSLLVRLVVRFLQEAFDKLLDQSFDLSERVLRDLHRQRRQEGALEVRTLALQEIDDHVPAAVNRRTAEPAHRHKGRAALLQEGRRGVVNLGRSLDGIHGIRVRGNGLGHADADTLLHETDRGSRGLFFDGALDDANGLGERGKLGRADLGALIPSLRLVLAHLRERVRVLLVVEQGRLHCGQALVGRLGVGNSLVLLLLGLFELVVQRLDRVGLGLGEHLELCEGVCLDLVSRDLFCAEVVLELLQERKNAVGVEVVVLHRDLVGWRLLQQRDGLGGATEIESIREGQGGAEGIRDLDKGWCLRTLQGFDGAIQRIQRRLQVCGVCLIELQRLSPPFARLLHILLGPGDVINVFLDGGVQLVPLALNLCDVCGQRCLLVLPLLDGLEFL
mmetsp:Transcript_90910/g.256266  ORF Transcript_90910/g.256266 Transcript_90910/m.256266 type:complete len:596 (-) Transcript_90910:347-2134(-)